MGGLACSGAGTLAPVTDPAPSRIGPFRVIAPLGAGGMGVVYRAEDETLRRVVPFTNMPIDSDVWLLEPK